MDRSSTAAKDPATPRESSLQRIGDITAKTDKTEVVQFHSKFFQILPLVIPFMVPGPDFFPDKRWRRIYQNSPIVTPQAFVASSGRRVEQCRTDWNALPILRNVVFKWQAEHTMSSATSFAGKANEAMHTD
eukprot:3437129-Karenia_brevis.AAC.1